MKLAICTDLQDEKVRRMKGPKILRRQGFYLCAAIMFSFPAVGYAGDEILVAQTDTDDKKSGVQNKAEPNDGPSDGKRGSTSWQQLTGADYLTMPPVDREIYVVGLSDAYNWSYVGGFKKMQWIVNCTENKNSEQLSLTFDDWLEENPARWDEPAAKLFAFAVFSACGIAPPTGKKS